MAELAIFHMGGLANKWLKKKKPEKKLSPKYLQALHGKDSPTQALLWISISGRLVPANGLRFVQKQEANVLVQ